MDIKTKYNIHDKVTIEDWVETYTTCPICEGKGIIAIKDKDFRCPECNGKKHLEVEEKQSFTVEITDIIIKVNSDGNIKTEYIADWSDWGPNNYHYFYE